MNFTEYSYRQLMEQVVNRFDKDALFREFTKSSKFRMSAEMFAAMTEMIMYYIERRAEETYTKTAKLDSTAILLSQDLGYVVKRAIPAQAGCVVSLKGAVPDWVKPGMRVMFDKNALKLSAGSSKFVFMKSFSYELTPMDLLNPLKLNINFSSARMMDSGENSPDEPIKMAAGEFIEKKWPGVPGKFQEYKIDDIDFSNWYGEEDYGSDFDAYCQVWISNDGANWGKTAWKSIDWLNTPLRKFKVNRSFKIDDPGESNCVIETGMDKLPSVKFGDDRTWSGGARTLEDAQGAVSKSQWVHVRYLKTNGAAGNFHEAGGQISKTGPVYIDGKEAASMQASFSFATPSFGGADMEKLEQILRNAPHEFSRFERLVTKMDYQSYLLALTSPFPVNHAVAWSESDEIDDIRRFSDDGKEVIAVRQFANGLVYSIVGNVYDGESIKVNFSGKGNNPLTLWTDEGDAYYDSALGGCQYFQMMTNPSHYQDTVANDSTIQDLNFRLEKRALLSCSEHRPISPIIHYFEAVGTVTLSPMADLQSVKSETLSNLYGYLEKKGFRDRIDKSEIEEIILGQPGVQAVSLRFIPMHDINSKTFNVETGLLSLNSLNNFLDANPVYNGSPKSSIIRQIYDIIAKWFLGERVFTKTDALRYATDEEFPAMWVQTLMRKDGPDTAPPDWKPSTINERHYWTVVAEDIKSRKWFSDHRRLYAVLKEVHGGIQRYLTNSLIDSHGNISGFTMPCEMAAVVFNRPFAYQPGLVPSDFSLAWKYGY